MGSPITPGAGGTEVYTNMEQWTEIRRRVLVEGLSKRQACKQFAINWKTLQKILTNEEPPGYRRVKPPRRPTIEPVVPVIGIEDPDSIRSVLEHRADRPTELFRLDGRP